MVGNYYKCGDWQKFVSLSDPQLSSKCILIYTKGSGKGGQKRNKTSNRVQVKFFHLSTSEEASRYLSLNITKALRKLRFKISLDIIPNYNLRPLPSLLLSSKYKKINLHSLRENKPDYPLFCGWLLDSFIAQGGDWKLLSKKLTISNSQMTSWFAANALVKEKFLQVRQSIKNPTTALDKEDIT
ncbi:MAG: hypothetical protein JJV97_02035 [SAR324 cluster bacterium]|nr:hypothetical protein [SAR324 cluster bacterium]